MAGTKAAPTLEISSSDVKREVLSLEATTVSVAGLNITSDVSDVLKNVPGIENLTPEKQGNLKNLAEGLKKQIAEFRTKTDSVLDEPPMIELPNSGRQSRHLKNVS